MGRVIGSSVMARAKSGSAVAATVASVVALACSSNEAPPRRAEERAAAPAPRPAAPFAPPWATPALEEIAAPDGERFALHRWTVPVEGASFSLEDAQRGVDAPLARADGAVLAVNAGFFHADWTIDGLAIDRGRVLSPVRETLGGAVFHVASGRARIDALDRLHLSEAATEVAIQCMPRLVDAGAAAFTRETGRRANRTALCVRDRGRTLELWLVRAKPPGEQPTLRQLAAIMAGARCEDALNLDGGPSSGAAWRERDGTVASLPPRSKILQALVVRARR